jgi:hypothetical protein
VTSHDDKDLLGFLLDFYPRLEDQKRFVALFGAKILRQICAPRLYRHLVRENLFSRSIDPAMEHLNGTLKDIFLRPPSLKNLRLAATCLRILLEVTDRQQPRLGTTSVTAVAGAIAVAVTSSM